ncbi:MAG: general secretion pathway protein GspB [Pseudomonadota bacterium]
MSLILEALRKSEAERRRGSTPDVAMELPPTALPRARANPAWLLPAALFTVVALLAAGWWSQRDEHPSARLEPVATSSSSPPQPVIEPPPPSVVIARPAPAPTATSAPLPAPPTTAPPVQAAPVAMPAPVPPQPVPPPAPSEASDVADIDATSLPPVKLSMHMWDASPGKRFVILDGQRMGEGDRNGLVTVVAIERDGVVVERNGQRARVPLP